MIRIGIIGIGNELRGDDAVGLVIARALQLVIGVNRIVDMLSGEQLPRIC